MDCCSSLRSDFRKELLPRGSCLDHSHIFCCKQNEERKKSKSVNSQEMLLCDFIKHKSGTPGERLVVI